MRINRKDLAISRAFEHLEGDDAMLKNLSEKQKEELEQEVAQYRNLKMNLNLLKEIPECQLTADHLRSRILAEGMHCRPMRDWSIYVATATAAVSCLVLGFVWWNQSGKQVSVASPVSVSRQNLAQNPIATEVPIQKVATSAASLQTHPQSHVRELNRSHSSVPSVDTSHEVQDFNSGSQLVALDVSHSVDPRTAFKSAQPRNNPNLGYRHGFGPSSNPANVLSAPIVGLVSPPLVAASFASYNAIKNGKFVRSQMNSKSGSTTLITLQTQRDKRTGLIEAKEEPTSNDVPLGG